MIRQRKKASGFVETIKKLDVHPKTAADVQVKSGSGAVATTLALLIVGWMCYAEIASWAAPEEHNVVIVDPKIDRDFHAIIDVTFHALACNQIQLDVVDEKGFQQKDAYHEMYKTHVGPSQARKDYSTSILKLGNGTDGDCGNCYWAGRMSLAHSHDLVVSRKGHCCNTCQELIADFKTRGLPKSAAMEYPQCSKKLKREEAKGVAGCRLHGGLVLKKGKGNFHVSSGHSIQQQHHGHQHHVHTIDRHAMHSFNVSHTIHMFRMGKPIKKEFEHPMDDLVQVFDKIVQHKYTVQIVPTEVTYAGGDVEQTNLYSFSQHTKIVDPTAMHHVTQPGVYWHYQVSPMSIKVEISRRSLAHLLTRLCAVAGGGWVVFSLVYRVYSLVVDQFAKLLDVNTV